MQNVNNRVHSPGKIYIKCSQIELWCHSPLFRIQWPASCYLVSTMVGVNFASLLLCIGLLWMPKSKSSISRSLFAVCESVTRTKTAISHSLIGFLIWVWWMMLFSLLSPPLLGFLHFPEKGNGRKEKNIKVQHMVSDISSLTLKWTFRMLPLVVTDKVPTKLPQGKIKT